MKLYCVEALKLEPIILMCHHWQDANTEFHFAMMRAFGFMPKMSFKLFQTDEELLSGTRSLTKLLKQGRPGFAVQSSEGWRRYSFDID